MSERLRVMLGSVGWTGHAFPVLALARELRERGHDVLVETTKRHRDVVEGLGLRLLPAAERMAFGGIPHATSDAPTLAQATESLLENMRGLRPDIVVSDLFTLAPALAAEAGKVPRATLIHHPYPVHEPGLPLFFLGMLPPRTRLGAGMWHVVSPLQQVLQPRLRRVRAELNRTRAELGLAPLASFHGPISETLTMVATFPQLEYPRRWPPHVHVTGPMLFDLPHPDVGLPHGEGPLVLVGGSTEQDQELRLVRTVLEALADEPVRVLANMSRKGRQWTEPVPDNAVVVDWVSYAQVMPHASLVVCTGGAGTVARTLAAGLPLLVWPAGADMAENGARATWAGAGLMLPRPFLKPGPLRWAVRRLLRDPSFAARAREIAAWACHNSGSARGADLVEAYARR